MPLWDSLPLTPSDLHAIADAVEHVEDTLDATNTTIGRVEILRPDSEPAAGAYPDSRIGWVTRFDESDPTAGWGFLPDTDHLEDVM